ncbi:MULTISPECIES: hypothetical protein [Cyanophyceae]|nr:MULTISPECIES: hypothetical protein [Cyanophyceae]MBD1916653.1 hypothetical protein [Phormidium sp. FACHB-77]MBD2030010.1 hypothetical protein [Phormidium sp. FACHB-322]MBD2053221.1 hypothetical protein [Leptolyngbya sp. FACHB-60]
MPMMIENTLAQFYTPLSRWFETGGRRPRLSISKGALALDDIPIVLNP